MASDLSDMSPNTIYHRLNPPKGLRIEMDIVSDKVKREKKRERKRKRERRGRRISFTIINCFINSSLSLHIFSPFPPFPSFPFFLSLCPTLSFFSFSSSSSSSSFPLDSSFIVPRGSRLDEYTRNIVTIGCYC